MDTVESPPMPVTKTDPENCPSISGSTEKPISGEENSASGAADVRTDDCECAGGDIVSCDDTTTTLTRNRTNRGDGEAAIKAEFIVHDYKPRLETAYISESVKRSLDASDTTRSTDEPPTKQIKLKGQNTRKIKQRWREEDSTKLCPTIVLNKKCDFGEKCRFSHDINEYLKMKLPNITGDCPSYRTFGYCTYGITCLFSHDHLSSENKNLVNEELWKEYEKNPQTLNVLTKKLTCLLRKRNITFSKSEQYFTENGIKPYFKMHGEECNSELSLNGLHISNDNKNKLQASEEKNDSNKSASNENDSKMTHKSEEKNIQNEPDNLANNGCKQSNASTAEMASTTDGVISGISNVVSVNEGEIRLRQVEKTKINFQDKLYLAPLTTVGNLPFRRVCKQYGADITCGEMAMVTSILQGKHSEWALLKRHSSEDIFGVQVCGGHPDSMTRCAELIDQTCDVDFIDINLGCPIDLVYKKGEGSALMNRWTRLESIMRGMVSVVSVPLTVKMRTGVFEDTNLAHKLLPKCREWGAALATLHGRSREQRYTKSANWTYIAECAQQANPMPLIGNGDILSYEDYETYRASSGVNGTMIARGALIKPWIFTEIKERRHWDISSSERLDMLKQFVRCGLTHWGSDAQGVETTRRFLLEWLSFLYRYIPVGVLERVPQRINERPPPYFGRDDLETLMASANCADWIKISVLLLGPVPPGFSFLPKHKANAYK